MSAFHISLSRVVTLRHHQIQPFVDFLSKTVRFFSQGNCVATLGDYELYRNDDRSRSFVSLNVRDGVDVVLALIELVNSTMKQFNCPLYYKNPQPHATFAWTLGNLHISPPSPSAATGTTCPTNLNSNPNSSFNPKCNVTSPKSVDDERKASDADSPPSWTEHLGHQRFSSESFAPFTFAHIETRIGNKLFKIPLL